MGPALLLLLLLLVGAAAGERPPKLIEPEPEPAPPPPGPPAPTPDEQEWIDSLKEKMAETIDVCPEQEARITSITEDAIGSIPGSDDPARIAGQAALDMEAACEDIEPEPEPEPTVDPDIQKWWGTASLLCSQVHGFGLPPMFAEQCDRAVKARNPGDVQAAGSALVVWGQECNVDPVCAGSGLGNQAISIGNQLFSAGAKLRDLGA